MNLKEKITRYCDDHSMCIKDFLKLLDMACGTYYVRMKSNNWHVGELVRLKAILDLTDQEVLQIINDGVADLQCQKQEYQNVSYQSDMKRNNLHYRIIGSKYSMLEIAKMLRISRSALYKKVQGEISWKHNEIRALCDLLGIYEDEEYMYFN